MHSYSMCFCQISKLVLTWAHNVNHLHRTSGICVGFVFHVMLTDFILRANEFDCELSWKFLYVERFFAKLLCEFRLEMLYGSSANNTEFSFRFEWCKPQKIIFCHFASQVFIEIDWNALNSQAYYFHFHCANCQRFNWNEFPRHYSKRFR